MSNNGWVLVYRKIEDCPALECETYDNVHAWIYLVLAANHKAQNVPFDGHRVHVERGQLITSVRKLSIRFGWSKDRTLRFLRSLEANDMIKRQSDNHRTLISIVNYDVYQRDTNKDTNRDTKQDTNEDTSRTPQALVNTGKSDNSCDTNKDTNEDTDKDTNRDTNKSQTKNIKEYKENNNNVAPREQREKDIHDFEIIYKMYPKKKAGKQKALQIYLGWTSPRGRCVNGRYYRLTNKQVWDAVKNYLNHNDGTEQQYLKNFDTLMNQILDWIPDNEGDNE